MELPLMIQSALTLALVVLTFFYLKATFSQAETMKKSFDETRKTRLNDAIPIFAVRQRTKPGDPGLKEIYVVNVGKGPALNINLYSTVLSKSDSGYIYDDIKSTNAIQLKPLCSGVLLGPSDGNIESGEVLVTTRVDNNSFGIEYGHAHALVMCDDIYGRGHIIFISSGKYYHGLLYQSNTGIDASNETRRKAIVDKTIADLHSFILSLPSPFAENNYDTAK